MSVSVNAFVEILKICMNYRAEAGETSSGARRKLPRRGKKKHSRRISGSGTNELSVAADIRPRHKLVNAAAESVNGVSMQYGIWGRFCIEFPRHPGQNHPKIKIRYKPPPAPVLISY